MPTHREDAPQGHVAHTAPGDSMANAENLIGHSFADQTASEQRELARMGGIASGKARREKKILREAILKRLKAEDLDEIADGIITRAKKRRADAETFRDTVDGKPKETIEQDSTVEVTADVNLSIDEAREAFLAAFRDKCKG